MRNSTTKRKAPTEEQKAAAAARRERFKQLAKHVSEMSDDERQEIVMRHGAVITCQGRTLTVFNSMLLISQLPTISMVGGFWQWKDAGRKVRKGATGLMLWIPAKGNANSEAGPTTAGETIEQGKKRYKFVMGTVFDISQTEPIDEGTADVLDERADEIGE